MTVFVIACVVMVVAALALIVWPLLKAPGAQPAGRYLSIGALAVGVPLIAVLVYANIGRVNWEKELTASQQGAPSPEVEAMVTKLEERLRESPNDVDGWLLLGRSYMALERPQQSLSAYREALERSDRKNMEALLGVAESMMVIDERTIAGEAGKLFEEALAQEPNNPKALWYSAIASLAAQNLPQAHERFQRLLALNPPGEIRSIIERQLQDIEQQLGAAPARSATLPAANEPQRAITVNVSLAPNLAGELDRRTPLFVVARDPSAPGPPLAAVRRAVGDLPFTVTITDNDAMMQGRGIASAQNVQIVARISKSGTPQAQSGDLYGEANVTFGGDEKASVRIVIDRAVGNN